MSDSNSQLPPPYSERDPLLAERAAYRNYTRSPGSTIFTSTRLPPPLDIRNSSRLPRRRRISACARGNQWMVLLLCIMVLVMMGEIMIFAIDCDNRKLPPNFGHDKLSRNSRYVFSLYNDTSRVLTCDPKWGQLSLTEYEGKANQKWRLSRSTSHGWLWLQNDANKTEYAMYLRSDPTGHLNCRAVWEKQYQTTEELMGMDVQMFWTTRPDRDPGYMIAMRNEDGIHLQDIGISGGTFMKIDGFDFWWTTTEVSGNCW